MTVKTTNALMKHLREHGIEIRGSTEKMQLRNLGYYHLYKGYRFYRTSQKKIPFNDFDNIRRTYEYDMDIKSLFYQWTTYLETALKNVVLQTTIEYTDSESLRLFYDKALESGASLQNSKKKDKTEATSKKLQEIKFLQGKILESYRNGNPIIQHHYDTNDEVPIWGLFEIITFGDFGKLVQCLKLDLRKKISSEIGINSVHDQDARILENYIFLIKDLRNSIAHDNVVYDGRFIKNKKASGVRKNAIKHLETETNIPGINFSNIEDLLILICYLLKRFGIQKRQIKSLVNSYVNLTNDFIADINDSDITDYQIRADTLSKAKKILLFI